MKGQQRMPWHMVKVTIRNIKKDRGNKNPPCASAGFDLTVK